MEFPPIGCNRRFIVFGDDKPFAGFEEYSQACAVANMYKKPGNPKRPENACERINWTVKDMTTGAVVFTAPNPRLK